MIRFTCTDLTDTRRPQVMFVGEFVSIDPKRGTAIIGVQPDVHVAAGLSVSVHDPRSRKALDVADDFMRTARETDGRIALTASDWIIMADTIA